MSHLSSICRCLVVWPTTVEESHEEWSRIEKQWYMDMPAATANQLGPDNDKSR